MAANSNCRGITILGKRVVNQIWTSNSAYPSAISPSALTVRRATYSSVYEKNIDDEVRPSVVPEDVIQAAHSDKYWAPHPQTGVFGPAPATDHVTPSATSSAANAGTTSVLDEKAWFRPTSLEDLEKPHHLP